MTERERGMRAPFTPEVRNRLVRAMLASAALAGLLYPLIRQVALPALLARLTPAQIEWLREAFVHHRLVVVGAILVLAAVLALPVFGVFRWVFGPLTTTAPRG